MKCEITDFFVSEIRLSYISVNPNMLWGSECNIGQACLISINYWTPDRVVKKKSFPACLFMSLGCVMGKRLVSTQSHPHCSEELSKYGVDKVPCLFCVYCKNKINDKNACEL